MKGMYKRKRNTPPNSDQGNKRSRWGSTGVDSVWEKRGLSMNVRRDGLLNQFLHRNKTSIVVDSRIGERNVDDEEEKMARRMAAERSKQYNRKTIFNLNDEVEEFLTHKGETIANIERYDDPRDDSGSEDELLDKDFVKEAHFGGFLKMKKQDSSENINADGKEKSNKEIIQELIMNTRAKKLEKAQKGDEYLAKVSNLNSMFKDEHILSLVQSVPTKKEETGLSLTSIMMRNNKVESLAEDHEPEADTSRSKASESSSMHEEQTPNCESDLSVRERVQRKNQYEDAMEKLERPQDVKFGRIVRELKFDAKPARVDPVKAAGVITSEDLGANWEVNEVNNVPSLILIPKNYKEYTDFILAYCKKSGGSESLVEYDREMLSYVNDQMIDNHMVSHRGKLSDLCTFLLEFTMTIANNVDIFDEACVIAFTPYLFHRIFSSSKSSAELADIFVEKLREVHRKFAESSPKTLPNSVIYLITLCSHIFDIAEVRHRVISPTLIFLFQILGEMKVTNGKTARQILQLCYDCYTFLQETQRYAPEILQSLCALLKCFYSPNTAVSETVGFQYLLKQRDDVYETHEIFLTVLTLIKKFIKLYSSFPTASDMFKPIRDALYVLKNRAWVKCEWPDEYTPEHFKKNINDMIFAVEKLTAERERPRTAAALPKPLRLYEPEFQEVFTGKKRSGTREQQDHGRLLHKIKKEQKGAIRELKKDSAFLARAQQQEQFQLDESRKRKVKMIIGSLSNQEGDFKKLRREKQK